MCKTKKKDRAAFLILIARCDPLIIIPIPLCAVGHLGWAWAEPFVYVQETVKQIGADRYGNDSKNGGYGVCAGGGQCLPDHQKEGNVAGMWEQRG